MNLTRRVNRLSRVWERRRRVNPILTVPDMDLVAIDPGETSGVVEIRRGRLALARSLSYRQIVEAVAFNGEPVRSWQKCKLWVVEDFRVYPWVSAGFDAVLSARLLGALEAAALRGGVRTVYQMAGLAKFIDDDKLRLLGWWDLLKDRHQRDAARHAACFMLRRKVT